MADKDRIVYPDEVEAVKEEKAAAKSIAEDGDSNSIEEPADAAVTGAAPQIGMRNMISVPDNCPPGYKLIDGVCREVFD